MPDTFETRRQNNEQAHRDVAGDSVRPGSLDPGLSTPADTALGDVVWLTEELILLKIKAQMAVLTMILHLHRLRIL